MKNMQEKKKYLRERRKEKNEMNVKYLKLFWVCFLYYII